MMPETESSPSVFPSTAAPAAVPASRTASARSFVYANQVFNHILNEYGIPHEAEEYNGVWNENKWSLDGRVVTEVLPFFQQHLVFSSPVNQGGR